jgi:hypothetical protein
MAKTKQELRELCIAAHPLKERDVLGHATIIYDHAEVVMRERLSGEERELFEAISDLAFRIKIAHMWEK